MAWVVSGMEPSQTYAYIESDTVADETFAKLLTTLRSRQVMVFKSCHHGTTTFDQA